MKPTEQFISAIKSRIDNTKRIDRGEIELTIERMGYTDILWPLTDHGHNFIVTDNDIGMSAGYRLKFPLPYARTESEISDLLSA